MAKIGTLLLQALLENDLALYTPITLLGNAFLEGPETHPQKYLLEIRGGGPWKHRSNVPLVHEHLLGRNSIFLLVRIVICRSASKSSRAGPMLKVLALGIRCLIQGVPKRLTRPVVVSLRWALPGVISNCKKFNSKGVSDKIREHVAEWRWQRRVARWAGQGC